MKKLYLVCFVTLVAVFVDIVFFHSRTAHAQATQRVTVQAVTQGIHGLDGAVADVQGTIIGFACHSNEGAPGACYVAVVK